MKEVKDFDDLISKLDRLLVRGITTTILARNSMRDAKDAHQKEKLFKEYIDKHGSWIDEVDGILSTEPDRMYYMAHFTNLPRNALLINYLGLTPDESQFISHYENQNKALEEILILLEERRNVLIRLEAAKIERDKSVLYEMTFADHEIRINGFYLSKPVFNSPNDNFFDFVFDRPGQKIPVDEIRKTVDLKKTVHQVLNDLGITGDIKRVFMPNTSNTAVEFRNPITFAFAEENKLPTLNLGRSNKKE